MDTLVYKKPNYEVKLAPRGRGMLARDFFQLGMIVDKLVGKPQIKLSKTCDDCKGREINKNYHPSAAKEVFDHFNQDLLDKVIEMKKLNGLF